MVRDPSDLPRSLGGWLPHVAELKLTNHEKQVADNFVAVFAGHAERGGALVWAARLDESLTNLLRSVMHQNKADLDEMFRDGGPLGNFGVKIKLGYLLGLYGEMVYKDLICIYRIRNLFAHKGAAKDFSYQPVRDLTKNLVAYYECGDFLKYQPDAERPDIKQIVRDELVTASLFSTVVIVGLGLPRDHPQTRFLHAVAFLTILFFEYVSKGVKLGAPARL